MPTPPAAGDAPVLVFVHVHYPDIWRGMSTLLAQRLAVPFHLVLTSPHPTETLARPDTPAMRSFRVLPTENRGRDVLPFLRALAATQDFDVGLKLHTKRSPQREDGAQWRGAVLDSLLPVGGVLPVVRRLRTDPRIGVVTPGGFCLSVRPWVLQNRPGMAAVLDVLQPPLDDADMEDAVFAAGSMFWFRRTALAALADTRVMALFEPEEGQLDGTVAHGMERLFPVVAGRAGLVSLAVPALLETSAETPKPALLAVMRQHADVPSRYFPAPYVAALPPEPVPPPLPAPAPRRLKRLLLPAWGLVPERVRARVRPIMRRLLGRR